MTDPAEVLSWPSNVCPEGWEIVERTPGPTFMGMTIRREEWAYKPWPVSIDLSEYRGSEVSGTTTTLES
jgi:hypothetical protein